MGTKKIVPLRPRQKEGSKGAPKPLTLADIAITWTEGMGTWETRHYVSGASLARAVLYLRHRHPHTLGHDPLGGDVGPIPSYLRGLAYVMFPDAGAPSEDLEKDVRYNASLHCWSTHCDPRRPCFEGDRLLDCEPVAAQDGSGSEGDRGADPRLHRGKAGSPAVRLGGPQGEAAFRHPGRTAREPREQRLSVRYAARARRALIQAENRDHERLVRDGCAQVPSPTAPARALAQRRGGGSCHASFRRRNPRADIVQRAGNARILARRR